MTIFSKEGNVNNLLYNLFDKGRKKPLHYSKTMFKDVTQADLNAAVISGLFEFLGRYFGRNEVLDINQVKKEKEDGTVRR